MKRPPRANGYRDSWCGELSAARTGTPARAGSTVVVTTAA